VLLAVAVACYRLRPGAGLAVAWLAGIVQVASGIGLMTVELSLLLLVFGTARHGRMWTVRLAAVSIPAAIVVGAGYFATNRALISLGVGVLISPFRANVHTPLGFFALRVIAAIMVLSRAFSLGLLLRVSDGARHERLERRRAELERARAQEEGA